MLTRRDFLKRSGVTALTLLGGPALAAPRYKTRHVVLVVFGGGVRSRDTFGTPANIPNLMRFRKEGVICPNIAVRGRGHFVSTLSILEGAASSVADAAYARGTNPTVFEYVRKGNKLKANAAWLSSVGGQVQRGYAFSAHPEYGEEYGANLIDTEGALNTEFRRLVTVFGRPRPPSEAELNAGAKLQAALAPPPAIEGEAARDEAGDRRMHRYIVKEVARERVRPTGPGAGDEGAIAMARSLLTALRPAILGVVLQNADIAHGSYDSYVDVIRRNDAQLGKLWDTIQADPALRDKTTMMVLPEIGRNRARNGRGGLDHNDASEDLLKVAMFAAGPDIRTGRIVRREMESIDVCPTICKLMGIKPEFATGKVMRSILA